MSATAAILSRALGSAGRPGDFYGAEEGTKLHSPTAHPRLFFLAPRMGRAVLKAGRVDIEAAETDAMTKAVRT